MRIKDLLERIVSWFSKFIGYLVPIVQTLPAYGFWGTLMTVPLISYLILLFSSPESFQKALYVLLTKDFYLEKAFIIIGFSIFVYSTSYLIIKRKEGLVTTGPYRLVRHPQYLGIILFTLGFTSWSQIALTRGIGYPMTLPIPLSIISVWHLELLAYILLAYIEELYLSRKYRESFKNYQNQVPFLIPFLKTKRKSLDILVSILIPAIILRIVLWSFYPYL